MSSLLKICLTGICLLLQNYLSAQEKTENYLKTAIPDSLRENANVVCRLDEHEINIISTGKMTERIRTIYTIQNQNGDPWSTYYSNYDKMETINSFNGTLYNSNGKEVKHVKKKDMSDFSNPGDAFVSDNRIKVVELTSGMYPYSVEFEEEKEYNETYSIPRWMPVRGEKTSLMLSRYILTVPAGYKFRYKLINADIKPVITQNKDKITYIWEVRNLSVIPNEKFSVSAQLYSPFMLVGPYDFEMDGYLGSLSSWKDYGLFYSSLYKGKDILPDELKAKVHELTDKVSDPNKKIAILYDYLQQNTHYVLIMFGIGGLQPYDAAYVAKNKYGDCKALSNFMVALLKEAGIIAHPVVIWAGAEPHEFYSDIPSHQSNHIICMVPMQKDTVWLECTSQILPAGFLGEFTQNRYGLMFDESGGTLVHTPAYTIKDNTSKRSIMAKMDDEGNLQIKSETNYTGLSFETFLGLSREYSKDKQLEYLKERFDLPTYQVNGFEYTENTSTKIPQIQESLDLSVSNYAHLTGKRIFFYPNILSRSKIKFSDDKTRKLDFQFTSEYSQVDSVTIVVPAGYQVESVWKDKVLETKFGRYQTHFAIEGDKIFYYRRFDQYSGRFSASMVEEVRSFYNAMYVSDDTQIVLVKKANG